MILKNFYDSQLAHASYLVGCAGAGEAVVIDPNRNLEPYLAAAEAEGLKIVAVTETHIHADYVSGARELAARTGATLYLSDEGPPDWKYAFADEPNVRLVRDGDAIRVGNLRLDVVATPGHTPEHIAFVLTDEAAGAIPYGAFTGDFIFIGDVGRPDLLERAAGFAGTMEEGGRTLYRSLQRFRRYPETMLLWPAHGSGSPCGKSLGGVPTSSYGYELATNWGLQATGEDVFVKTVLEGQPEPPAYFKEMKRINKEGPKPTADGRDPERIAGERALQAAQFSLVLDLRPRHQSSAGTLPGAINIPLDKGFVIRAGSVLPFGEPLYLLAVNEAHAATATRMLGQIGFDSVLGWFGPDVLHEYEKGADLQVLPSISASELRRTPEVTQIVDVRGEAEVAAGRIDGSLHIPLGDLARRATELRRDRPVVVHCASGARSAVAGTILKRLGFRDVSSLEGGYDAYIRTVGEERQAIAP